METETIETIDRPEVLDLSLVALTPTALGVQQQNLIEWCTQKITRLNVELEEAGQNLDVAVKHGWRTSGHRSHVNLTDRRITYYQKVKQALEEGYLIIPDFPIDVVAIRTNKRGPRSAMSTNYWAAFRQKADSLPSGEGRYVSSLPEVHQRDVDLGPDSKNPGKNKVDRQYFPHNFTDPEFPVRAVKPEVLRGAARAMALKLFDEIGIVPNKPKRDPIVIGRLKDPRPGDRGVSFFIAWWLNTEAL